MHSFRSEDTLVDVNQHILLNQPGPNAPFRLMTSFPRRVFTGEDSKRTLRELGQSQHYGAGFTLLLLVLFVCRPSALCCAHTNQNIDNLNIVIRF